MRQSGSKERIIIHLLSLRRRAPGRGTITTKLRRTFCRRESLESPMAIGIRTTRATISTIPARRHTTLPLLKAEAIHGGFGSIRSATVMAGPIIATASTMGPGRILTCRMSPIELTWSIRVSTSASSRGRSVERSIWYLDPTCLKCVFQIVMERIRKATAALMSWLSPTFPGRPQVLFGPIPIHRPPGRMTGSC